MRTVNAAIIYYSSTGTVHALASAAADGAPGDVPLRAAAYQARRAVDVAAALKAARTA